MSQLFPGLPSPSPVHVAEFQRLYEQRFETRLEPAEALSLLMRLLVITDYRRKSIIGRQQKIPH